MSSLQKPLIAVPVDPPGAPLPRRGAAFAAPGEKRGRYHLPTHLDTASPVGYRVRVPLTTAEAEIGLQLLALDRPSGFAPTPAPTEGELFEEHALGVLSARQSTNYRGQKVVTLGPEKAAKLLPLLARLDGREAEPLAGAAYTHVVFSRPYRTPFTMLLTLAPTSWRFRSERIQPGVNQEPKAPPAYQERPGAWTSLRRAARAGRPRGLQRLRALDRLRSATAAKTCSCSSASTCSREAPANASACATVATCCAERAPTASCQHPLPGPTSPPGARFSRNAARGRKAFALAGQRIYVGGLSRREVEAAGLDFERAVRAFGAAASRSALVRELMGVDRDPRRLRPARRHLPHGRTRQPERHRQAVLRLRRPARRGLPGREPTSLLVWTLKAKTVADPIGNEEQLLNAARKGALVDLRCGSARGGLAAPPAQLEPMRSRDGRPTPSGPSATWATSSPPPTAGRSRATAARPGPPRGGRPGRGPGGA
jgi:hypothetical protein